MIIEKTPEEVAWMIPGFEKLQAWMVWPAVCAEINPLLVKLLIRPPEVPVRTVMSLAKMPVAGAIT